MYRLRIKKCSLIVLATFVATSAATAADFATNYEGSSNIKMTGPIESGDAEKLVALTMSLLKEKGVAPFPRTIILDSPGGSVQEAARIASVVELLRLSTSVRGDEHIKGNRPGICASACFLVWLGGYFRYAAGYYTPTDSPTGDERLDRAFMALRPISGMVGLHRPFLDLKESSSVDMTESQGQQRMAMVNLRTYLLNRNVPSEIVERMMAHSSKNIYWLRTEEINALSDSPEYEELLASNCDFRKTIVTSKSSREDHLAFLHENSPAVQDALRACSRSLMSKLRSKELPRALSRMSQGWRPWLPSNK